MTREAALYSEVNDLINRIAADVARVKVIAKELGIEIVLPALQDSGAAISSDETGEDEDSWTSSSSDC